MAGLVVAQLTSFTGRTAELFYVISRLFSCHSERSRGIRVPPGRRWATVSAKTCCVFGSEGGTGASVRGVTFANGTRQRVPRFLDLARNDSVGVGAVGERFDAWLAC
jgi:hypothetical protein